MPHYTFDFFIILFLLIASVLCVKAGKLTAMGAGTAFVSGCIVFLATGLIGTGILAAFFIAGTLATSHKKKLKVAVNNDPRDSQRRTAGQVLANGGIAGTSCAAILLFPEQEPLLFLLFAASIASAMADTLSSELGTVYGTRFFNILTFRKEPRGLDGVISLEGTLIGALGALLIAALYSLKAGCGTGTLIITIAGIIGNAMDSILGAGLERKQRIGNNAVNFLNTLTGALVAWGIAYLATNL